MLKSNQNSRCALVLGSHVNAYSIVKELFEQSIKNIVLFETRKNVASYSNKVILKEKIDNTPELLLYKINELHKEYSFIVIFPTNDLHLANLNHIYDQISEFCYLPFNPRTVVESSDKYFQYKVCEKIGLPFPKTISVKKYADLVSITDMKFPLLVKPSTRRDLTTNVFRTMFLESFNDYERVKQVLTEHINLGVQFIVSEYIPGDDTNIYAYTCFRTNEGKILNEWSGKKLTQYPDNYGVFSSASNEAPEIVLSQGRRLVDALDAYGIVEPEFKYDFRDGKYKLMEANLRSMMWHRVGSISGVKLHATQFNYASGKPVERNKQDKTRIIHFVLMSHEIPNLISRKRYREHFLHNVFAGDQREWAIFEWSDILPFLFSFVILSKKCVSACQKRFALK